MSKTIDNLINTGKKVLAGIGLIGMVGLSSPSCIQHMPGRSYVPQSYFPEERKEIKLSGKGNLLLKRLNKILAKYCNEHYVNRSGFKCLRYLNQGTNHVELPWKDVKTAKLVRTGYGCTHIAINQTFWSGKELHCISRSNDEKGNAQAQECIDIILTLRDIYGR